MEKFWNISIGEVLTIGIALFALVAATILGIRQNRINKRLLELQDSVELYILFGPLTKIDVSGKEPNSITPTIIIQNLSTKMIYLNKYCYNGVIYPAYDTVIPPVSQLKDACYYINLPTNETIHVSFQIFFTDWSYNKWETSGFADLVDGQWKITNIPCKRDYT